MSDEQQHLVSASVYLAWWNALCERFEQDPNDKGIQNLLRQLDDIGRKNDATRPIFERGEVNPPSIHYSAASVPNKDFDWENGQIDFVRRGYLTVNPDVLITALVKETGIPEQDQR